MDLQSFREGMKTLTALPDGEVEQSLLIAGALNDDERADFYRRLKSVNDDLVQTDREAAEAVQEFENLERDVARAGKALERGGKEERERAAEMGVVEQELTSNP